jgi:hypothetical protein
MNRISSVESPARNRRAPRRRAGSAHAARAETKVLRKADLLPDADFECKVDLAVLCRNPHPRASGRGEIHQSRPAPGASATMKFPHHYGAALL